MEGETVLTLDKGNSSWKAIVWTNGVPCHSQSCGDNDLGELFSLINHFSPVGCALSDVCGLPQKIYRSFEEIFSGNMVTVDASIPLPMKLNYKSLSTLGADRIAAVAGAIKLRGKKPFTIVDAGTAMTIDLTDERGNFMGGNISPGMQLRFNSLHARTASLPLVDSSLNLPLFGEDTLSAIRCGVIRGMTAEIVEMWTLASKLFGCREVVLTGGDAPAIRNVLNEKEIDTIFDEYLVGRGLYYIFDYVRNHEYE